MTLLVRRQAQGVNGYSVDFGETRRVYAVDDATPALIENGALATFGGDQLSSATGMLSLATDANLPLIFLNQSVVGMFGRWQFSEVDVRTTHGATQANAYVGPAVFCHGDTGVASRDNHCALLQTNSTTTTSTWQLYTRNISNFTPLGSSFTGPTTERPRGLRVRLEGFDDGTNTIYKCYIEGQLRLEEVDSGANRMRYTSTLAGFAGNAAPGIGWGEGGDADTTRHVLRFRGGNMPERTSRNILFNFNISSGVTIQVPTGPVW